ncbi:MAG: hypothetical protein IPM42_21410 [Saprospiraceae bacterium]|nr:hypothetical protein [Saprospiraceae bacterium]
MRQTIIFRFIITVFCFVLLQNMNGQKYNTLGGIRIGDDIGYTFSQRIANKNTLQLLIQPGTFTGKSAHILMVNQHYPLLTKRINFFMGAGVYTRSIENLLDEQLETTSSSGVALNFGAEITLGNLSISTDYIPLILLHKNSDSPQRFQTSSGLSLRYVIVPRKSGTGKFFRKLAF